MSLWSLWFLKSTTYELQSDNQIRQIFYTSKIPKNLNFTREKRANRDIFGQQLRKEDVLLINFEQFFSFCAIFSFLLKYKLTPVVL